MATRRPLQIAPPKETDLKDLSCGECTACCCAFEIEEINKPDRTPCPSLLKGKCGCSIYEHRPDTCKQFKCLWVQNLVFKGDVRYRPDNLGVILTNMDTPTLFLKGLMGVFPVDHTKPFPRQALKFLWEIQKTVIYFDAAKEQLCGPKNLIDEWKKKWGVDATQ